MPVNKSRWRDLPDAQRAKQILLIVFWSAVVILYILGGFSLVLRKEFLASAATPTAVTTQVSPTSEPTIFPTLTPVP
ncbi:MAG: hypothetical protein ACYC6L_15810 [Anaerolineae bacterium]